MKTKKFTTTQLAILGLIKHWTTCDFIQCDSGCYLCNCVRTDGWGNCRSYLWTD